MERPKIRDILATEGKEDVTDEGGVSEESLAKIMGSVMGLPAPIAQMLMSVGDAMGKSFGYKSTSIVTRTYTVSYTAALRGLVLALHATNHSVAVAFDTPRGAFVEAQLPTDFFSMGGTVKFDIIDYETGAVTIASQSEIKGQKFDWGKGKRALNEVLDKTGEFAGRLGV
jgi:hypothetical protein